MYARVSRGSRGPTQRESIFRLLLSSRALEIYGKWILLVAKKPRQCNRQFRRLSPLNIRNRILKTSPQATRMKFEKPFLLPGNKRKIP